MLSCLPWRIDLFKHTYVLQCKQNFVGEQENNTILKKILKDLCFSGSCEDCDAVFVNKNVYEFYFLFVSFGWEWYILYFYI